MGTDSFHVRSANSYESFENWCEYGLWKNYTFKDYIKRFPLAINDKCYMYKVCHRLKVLTVLFSDISFVALPQVFSYYVVQEVIKDYLTT